MTPPKPQNHVTKSMSQFLSKQDFLRAHLPVLEEGALVTLETLYPPKCYDHCTENLEDHIKYGGMVELVERLRHRATQAREEYLSATMAEELGG